MNQALSNVFFGNTFDYVMANYLSIKDIYRLSLVSSAFYKKINRDYMTIHMQRRIEAKLKEIFNSEYGIFIKKMHEARAVISGSFILQCILNEKWENSDIDIYVEYTEDDKYLKILHEYLSTKTTQIEDGYYAEKDIHKTTNYFFDNDYKIQIVQFYTDIRCDNCMMNRKFTDGIKRYKCSNEVPCEGKKQTIWEHIKYTGFDICKNMAYFNDKLSLKLRTTNYREIINKCTTFTILDLEDFFYRIKKYSQRGFFFKPRYNKLVCLEYLLFKKIPFSNRMCIIKCDNIDKKKKILHEERKLVACNLDCSFGLLFRNIRHIHAYDWNTGKYNIYIYSTNHVFDKLLQNPNEETMELIKKMKNLDEYAQKRNDFAKAHGVPEISIYNKKNLKYEIQYGLPYKPLHDPVPKPASNPKPISNPKTTSEPIDNKFMSGEEYRKLHANKKKPEKKKDGWIVVGGKKKK